ncbi:MAG: AgmX/PglI C-terminal domain-containing protein [Deltaproteobacteria bacterium]|nr:AgmX/PglI C-terminal domain-containing protein [Deltaproteobacteria bacterium]
MTLALLLRTALAGGLILEDGQVLCPQDALVEVTAEGDGRVGGILTLRFPSGELALPSSWEAPEGLQIEVAVLDLAGWTSTVRPDEPLGLPPTLRGLEPVITASFSAAAERVGEQLIWTLPTLDGPTRVAPLSLPSPWLDALLLPPDGREVVGAEALTWELSDRPTAEVHEFGVITAKPGARAQLGIDLTGLRAPSRDGAALPRFNTRPEGGVGRFGLEDQTPFPRAPRVGTTLGEPNQLRGEDLSHIRTVIVGRFNQLRYCYQRELARAPGLAGEVTVRFVIGADGTVREATLSADTLQREAVTRCLQDRFLRMRFAVDREVVVSFPIRFRPEAATEGR